MVPVLSPHITSVQYCGGCSVHWRLFSTLGTVGDSFSTVGGSFSTLEVVQYSGGITSVHVGDNISTVESIQYCGEYSVLWRDTFSTVGGITAVHVGDSFSTVGG